MTVAQELAPLAQVLAPSTPPFAQFKRGLAPLAPLGTPRANFRDLRVLYEFTRFALLLSYLRLRERPCSRATKCQGCQGRQASSELRYCVPTPAPRDANPCEAVDGVNKAATALAEPRRSAAPTDTPPPVGEPRRANATAPPVRSGLSDRLNREEPSP